MASKDPSNIDKHIDYKLKLRLVDLGMSQEAPVKRLVCSMHDALLKICQRVRFYGPSRLYFTREKPKVTRTKCVT